MNIIESSKPVKNTLTFKDLKEGDLYQIEGDDAIRLKVRMAYKTDQYGSVYLDKGEGICYAEINFDDVSVLKLKHSLHIEGIDS